MTYLRSWIVLSLFTVASFSAAACSDGGSSGDGGAGGGPAAAPDVKGDISAGGSAPSGAASTSGSVSASASSAASASASSVSASASSAAGGGTGISFAADVQPIFTAACTSVGCHGGAAAKGLNLSSGKAHHELVAVKSLECGAAGRQLVEVGLPDQSYLIDKLKGMNLCGLGQRMPAGGEPALPAQQIQTIADWIAAGALDN